MEWEQRDLGGLGLAGICRETSRVVLRVILPDFANVGLPLLAAHLLAHAAVCCAVFCRAAFGLYEGTSLLRLVVGCAALTLLDTVCLLLSLLCTAAYALCVASLYRTGGDLRAADRVLKMDLPVVPLTRLVCTFLLVAVAVPFLVVLTPLSLAALLRVQDKIMLPLWLLGWASAAAYAAPVCHLACVVSVLEDAALFGAVRRSWRLLAGKFLAAACVFVTLDGCVVALVMAFQALVVGDALDLGLAFQVVAGAAMFLTLCAVLVATLVAQPVVYMVCKSHHQEVLDMAHLD
uniref:Uncharacterized protein n=1 Tax=Avena sativa TaxID=4498 RepID=A0ACD5W6Z5_AVESA